MGRKATDRLAVADPGGCGCAEPGSPSAETCYCTVDELVGAIARKHALSVVNLLGSRGSARFSRIQDELPRIGSSTLSETLRSLEQVGLVEREVFPETPPRVEYSLSEAGQVLHRRLRSLLERVRESR